MSSLSQIKIYPIKGLRGHELQRATLLERNGIVGDREYAITSDAEFDGSVWRNSRTFLINAVNDGLLKIDVVWKGTIFSLVKPNGQAISFNSETLGEIESFNSRLPAWLSDIVPGISAPRLVKRQMSMVPPAMWDFPDSEMSLLNLETLQALAKAIGHNLDIDRFRGNLVIQGLPAWSEFGLVGKRCRLGDAELEFLRPMRRCAATEVNPNTGLRDISVHKRLIEHFGHGYFGVYARVAKSGEVRSGDRLVNIGPANLQPSDTLVGGAGAYALWPKLASLDSRESNQGQILLRLVASNPWPLLLKGEDGQMKLHIAPGRFVRAAIVATDLNSVTVSVTPDKAQILRKTDNMESVIVTGPYRR